MYLIITVILSNHIITWPSQNVDLLYGDPADVFLHCIPFNSSDYSLQFYTTIITAAAAADATFAPTIATVDVAIVVIGALPTSGGGGVRRRCCSLGTATSGQFGSNHRRRQRRHTQPKIPLYHTD